MKWLLNTAKVQSFPSSYPSFCLRACVHGYIQVEPCVCVVERACVHMYKYVLTCS